MRNPLVMLLLLAAVLCPLNALGYGDPLYLPGSDSAADPMVIVVDGVYYLYPTNGFYVDRLECWSSVDLENWEYRGVVWGPAQKGKWNDDRVWAPHVERDPDSGLFYLYYTANQRIGLARSDSPIGPFEDVYEHPLIGGGHGGDWGNALDPFVWREPDGELFIYYVGYEPLSTIRVSRMTGYEHVQPRFIDLLRANPLSWEGFINEGPFMIERDGTYYLMFSGNGGNLPWYALGFATAHDPEGPFEKYVYNPILSTDVAAGFFGPGHNSVVRAADGSNDLLVFYHTKDLPVLGWERHVRVGRLGFTSRGALFVDTDDDDDEPPTPNEDDEEEDDEEEMCSAG